MARVCSLVFCIALCAQTDSDRVRRLHGRVVAVDSHIDTLQWVLARNADLTVRNTDYQVDFPRLRDGGIRAPYFALYVPTYYAGSEAIRRTLQLRDAMQRIVDANPEQIAIALNAADVERIAKANKIAAVLTIESGHAIADDLAVLRMYHQLGIRSMTLSHFRNNNWVDSSTDDPQHNGLTPFGHEVVREMNRLGMIVDVSHISDKAFFDVMKATTKPVIASHSSCRALSDFARNMTDDMLRALARNGGVVGINFGGGFLNQKDAAAHRSRIASRGAITLPLTGKALDDYAAKEWIDGYLRMKPTASTLEDVVAHIKHVVSIAGIDHVGIGSDFDGISSAPAGLEDISKMPKLTAALLKEGFTEKDIEKILGGNHLRVLRTVTGR